MHVKCSTLYISCTVYLKEKTDLNVLLTIYKDVFETRLLQVFAIEFGDFAIEFVPFAIEFVAFAIEFVPFAIEFVAFAIEFIAFAIEFVAFVVKFVAFVVKFVRNKNGSWRKHENMM